MIWIELTLSSLTLVSIWMITNRKPGGVWLGLILQFCWVAMWLFLGTYGFILIDCGIIGIYIQRLLLNYKIKNYVSETERP
jgi:hypothetical protein